jgi:endonuclease/exonuclease/phosphatase family metal-dependent hydrolase
MKIITLNTWNGTVGAATIEFFKKYSDVDVFLLQEISHNATERTNRGGNGNQQIFADISAVLPNHQGIFSPTVHGEWGLAAFVKKTITIEESGNRFVFRSADAMIGKDWSTIGRTLQYVKMIADGKKYTAVNLHGLWVKDSKSDTEDRIQQSQKVIDFIKPISDHIILAGDFNLRPDTESIKMIERDLNLKNLVVEYNIKSTRTPLYTKNAETFADYIFLSPTLEVKEFKVLPDIVSDHAALYVEVE